MKKKIIAILALVFVLAGCGSDNELEEFTDTYNKRATSEDVSELIPEEFGEIEKEEFTDEDKEGLDLSEERIKEIEEEVKNQSFQELYESDKYKIQVEYDKKDVVGYHITIDSSEPYEQKEGEGYRASQLIARSLGLNVGDYSKNYEKALNTNLHSYSENGYEIKFLNLGWDSSIPTSLMIGFEEK